MMVYRIPSQQKIERFWQWFDQNQQDFFQMLKAGDIEQVELKISNRLKSLSRLLVPIVEYDKSSGKAIFTLSADGVEGIFQAVEQTMKYAPNYDNWIFYAFKQPGNVEENDFIPDTDYKVSQVYVKLSENGNGQYIVDTFVVDYDPNDYYRLLSGIFKVLNKLLGEYKTVKLIDKVTVNPYENQTDLSKLIEINLLLANN